ncbi:MAG TPA: hypothetical protein VKR53_05575 [Puia sp.]|nr:hypothetical protein [Puia sp.]
MDKGLNIISPDFQTWIELLFNSTRVDLFLLYELESSKIDIAPFEIIIRQALRGNQIIRKPQGYLTFENVDQKTVANEFLLLGQFRIQKESYTIQGLANYLILIDRLGSLPDSLQFEIKKKLCSVVPKEDWEPLVMEFVRSFNTEYKYSHLNKEYLSFPEWENLFFSLQYFDHLDNPISLLRNIINFWNSKIQLINIIQALFPDPLAALFEYGIPLDSLIEEEILDHLKIHEKQGPFFGVLIVEEYNYKPRFLGKDLVDFLIKDQWGTVGKFLFRKIYNTSKRNLNEETKLLLQEQFDTWLTKYFWTQSKSPLLKDFTWPDDFLALGGWIQHVAADDLQLKLGDQFIQELAVSVSEKFRELNEKIPDFIAGNKSSHHFLTDNPFDTKAVFINTYFVYSVMTCENKNWLKVTQGFDSLCHKIKLLYYGSYKANRLALDLTNDLLCLILTYPKFDNDETRGADRISSLIEKFIDILAFQWIWFSEREDLIWNFSEHHSNYADSSLLYIIKRMNEPPQAYINIVSPLKLKIQEIATVKWPVD